MNDLPEGYVSVSELASGAVLLVHRDGTRVVASVDPRGNLWLDRRAPSSPTRRFVVEATSRQNARTKSAAADDGTLASPTGGVVQALSVDVGDRVEAGALLAVVEAMKMRLELRASRAGTVRAIAVAVGDKVDRGAVVLRLALD